MTDRKSRAFPVLLSLLIAMCCLGVAAFALIFDKIPDLARSEFGPAAGGLNSLNRFLYSARLLLDRSELQTPASTQGDEILFEIEPGESVNSILFRLESAGLIKNSVAFRNYLIYSGLDTGIQSGKYTLSPMMSPLEIGAALQAANPGEAVIVILAGWRAEEVAAALEFSGLSISPQEFMRVVNSPPAGWIPAGIPVTGSLEGYLFPGEYRFDRNANLQEVITTILKRFDASVPGDWRQAYEQNGLSFSEAVILASIIEKEGIIDEEKPMIASVFYNRMAIGMKLDSDPTVQYAVGYSFAQSTWWKNPLTNEDLNQQSPYNTYLNTGLPPGAICSPGLAAMQSTAYPAETPYYYFRAKCDGSGLHSFAETFDQHLLNACP